MTSHGSGSKATRREGRSRVCALAPPSPSVLGSCLVRERRDTPGKIPRLVD